MWDRTREELVQVWSHWREMISQNFFPFPRKTKCLIVHTERFSLRIEINVNVFSSHPSQCLCCSYEKNSRPFLHLSIVYTAYTLTTDNPNDKCECMHAHAQCTHTLDTPKSAFHHAYVGAMPSDSSTYSPPDSATTPPQMLRSEITIAKTKSKEKSYFFRCSRPKN